MSSLAKVLETFYMHCYKNSIYINIPGISPSIVIGDKMQNVLLSIKEKASIGFELVSAGKGFKFKISDGKVLTLSLQQGRLSDIDYPGLINLFNEGVVYSHNGKSYLQNVNSEGYMLSFVNPNNLKLMAVSDVPNILIDYKAQGKGMSKDDAVSISKAKESCEIKGKQLLLSEEGINVQNDGLPPEDVTLEEMETRRELVERVGINAFASMSPVERNRLLGETRVVRAVRKHEQGKEAGYSPRVKQVQNQQEEQNVSQPKSPVQEGQNAQQNVSQPKSPVNQELVAKLEIEIIKAEQTHKDAINNMYRKYSEWNTVDPLTNKIGSLDYLIKEGKIKVLPDGTMELVKESANYGIHEEHYFEDETLFANDIEGRQELEEAGAILKGPPYREFRSNSSTLYVDYKVPKVSKTRVLRDPAYEDAEWWVKTPHCMYANDYIRSTYTALQKLKEQLSKEVNPYNPQQ